ncbi:MAG: MBL fold metallo-hydrolase [Eggerthellaceae bacterium]|nr:MBL fold metallo-hydrolase [Eggerthellaceae bacterium]
MAVGIYPLLARDVFATYGYFIIDEDTGSGFLVDPGAQPHLFAGAIREEDWHVEAILLTHGHFDHMGAADELRDAFGIPVMAHEMADDYLLDAHLNLSASHGRNVTLPGASKFADGARIVLKSGNVELAVLHVPGHTNDSCALYCVEAGVAFVGDAIYEGGPGLTVFPTGDAALLRRSIGEKLLALPSNTVLLSGHSRPMAVEQLQRAMR